MKSYKELLVEKIRVRAIDLERYNMLTMILDSASKIAKASKSEVTESILKEATRSQLNQVKSALDIMKAKGVNSPKLEAEIKALNEFLGPQIDEEELRSIIATHLWTIPEDLRIKKNMKTIISSMKSIENINDVDPKLVNKILVSMLR